jgi:hypothetical protein
MSESTKCPQCGAAVDQGSATCKYCGEALPQQQAAPPQYVQQPQEPYDQQTVIIKQHSNPMGIAGLVLGILAAVGGWIPGINYITWLLGIIGIILSAIGMSKAKKANQSAGICVAGLVLSIIGLVIGFLGLLCTALCIGALGAAGKSLF